MRLPLFALSFCVAAQVQASTLLTRVYEGIVRSGTYDIASGPLTGSSPYDFTLNSRTDLAGTAFTLTTSVTLGDFGEALDNRPVRLTLAGAGLDATRSANGTSFALSFFPNRDYPDFVSFWNSVSNYDPNFDPLNYDYIGAYIFASRAPNGSESSASLLTSEDFVPIDASGLPSPFNGSSLTYQSVRSANGSGTQIYAFLNVDVRHFTQTLEAGPAAGVPEPASWLLMIAGFGLVGTARRRLKPLSA